MERWRWLGWMLLILSTAVTLRLFAITDIPPGLTHDEADHGLTAWQIVDQGARDIYFTIGYGREPFYDYATAALMFFLGPKMLAGRVTAVAFSLLTIAGMAAWVRRAFDAPTALFTAAGLAVGFWPLMSARQMLRSVTLPALFVLAVYLFWRGLEKEALDKKLPQRTQRSQRGSSESAMFLVVQKLTRILKRIPLIYFVTAGLLLGLTFYTYIPARGLWLIFPALLAYWLFTDRRLLRQLWWRVGLMVIVMLLVAGPLLRYLQANPTAEQRLGQLAQPLTAAQNGDLTPLLTNISGSLRLFFVAGDTAWRYNITGRPFLGPLMGGLFVLGLGTAIWFVVRRKSNGRRQQLGSASFLALAWLIAGLAPVLITGPTLSMTQAIGLQPVLYLFPALGLVTLGQVTIGSKQLRSYEWARWVVALLFLFTAVLTTRDYFGTWANDPEVRVQYETTMISAMNYLNRHKTASAVISTITPGPFHTPALAQMVVQDKELALHWFNARGALLLPAAAESQMLIPGFTPLSPALTDYLATAVLQTSLPMRKTDQDRPLDVYHIDQAAMLADWQRQFTPLDANFDGTLQLLGYDLQTPQVAPGEELRLVTWWQVLRPLPEAKLFTHLLGPDGVPLAQTDRLDVPGYAWQEGDMFVQLHRFFVPEATAVGDYALAVGLYTQNDGQRLPLQNPSQAADLFTVTKVTIRP